MARILFLKAYCADHDLNFYVAFYSFPFVADVEGFFFEPTMVRTDQGEKSAAAVDQLPRDPFVIRVAFREFAGRKSILLEPRKNGSCCDWWSLRGTSNLCSGSESQAHELGPVHFLFLLAVVVELTSRVISPLADSVRPQYLARRGPIAGHK